MKKIVSALICAVLLLSGISVFAEDTNKTYTLSLSDAINMAQERSPRLKALEVSEETYEYNLKLAKQNKAKMEGMKIKFPAGVNTALVRDGYIVAQNESSLYLAKKEMEQVKASISYSITEKYYNCVLMNNLLTGAKNTYDAAVKNKEVVDAKLSLGTIAKIEADNAELTVLSAKLAVENYERQKALAEEMLKIALEFTDDEIKDSFLVLTDGVSCEDFTADVNADSELAKENRFDMISLAENVKTLSLYTDLIEGYLGHKSTTYTETNNNLTTLLYNYENAKKQIGIGIKAQYSNVLMAKGNIQTAEMAVKVMKTQYEAARLRFELGMITNIDLTDILNSLHDREVALEQAKINYALAVQKYKFDVSIGL